MKNSTNVIANKQLIFTIIGATIGVGILTLSSTVARDARQDTWISILLGALFPLIGLLCINTIGKKFAEFTFAEYSELILGKWLGKLVSLLFVFYALAFASIVTRIFVDILKIYLFPITPVWALCMLILLISGYLASKDPRVLARVNELMFYEGLILFVFVLWAVPKMDITYFLPIGGSGLNNIVKGSYQTFFAFLGIEILLVIYPMVQNKKGIVKTSTMAIFIITAIYLLVVIITLGIFGPNALETIRFGLMVLLKSYTMPVIERGEFFFIIFWVFFSFRPVANMYFASRYTAEKMLGIESPNLTTIALFPLALLISLIPQNFEQAMNFTSALGLVGFGFIVPIPLILWLIATVRGIGGNKYA